jgi:hypothetical protein
LIERGEARVSGAYRLGSSPHWRHTRRDWLGISYVMIFDRVMDAFAPVVARLAGT